MKTFLRKLFLWLPLAFLVLTLTDMLFIHEHFFKTRYSVLQTPALTGLTLSFLVTTILETVHKEPKYGLIVVYRWYIATPIILILVLLLFTSMSR